VRLGIVGCGNVADNYVAGIARFAELELVGCASRSRASAERLAGVASVRAFPTVSELLASDDVDAVVNLTPPTEHHAVSAAAIDAGKHVFSEKPLTTDVASAEALLARAAAAGLLVGAAPDTFLGGGGQRARAMIDAGLIGRPVACAAFVRSTRPELWHPDPRFLFEPGGGPTLDLGPYYVTMLVSLLGPIATVSALAGPSHGQRVLSAPDRVADVIDVSVPTHVSASLRWGDGMVGTLISSFDVRETTLPYLEIYGDEATMVLGNPDVYDWPVRIRRVGATRWRSLTALGAGSLARTADDFRLRGIGLLDLARAAGGGPQRASGALALHVLDVLSAIERSSEQRCTVELTTSVPRPEPWRE